MCDRLDKLYTTNAPGIRGLANICDSYIDLYGKLKNNLIIVNTAHQEWYNSWIPSYDDAITDVSLSTIYASDRNLFAELQQNLANQMTFFNSIKASKLPNGDAVSFTYGSTTNQNRTLKGRFNMGSIGNLTTDISTTLILDTASDADLDTNKYISKYYFQIGDYNVEDMHMDLHFGGADPANISNLYDYVINATDGTNLVDKNNRLIGQLAFNINKCNNFKLMLASLI
jgi:hypothetical protein